MERILASLGGSTARHPWRTILCWLLAGIAITAIGQAAGGRFTNDFRFPGAESQRAADLAEARFPAYGAATADIVFATGAGQIGRYDTVVRQTLDAIRSQPRVAEVDQPTPSPDQAAVTSTIRYRGQIGDLGSEAYQRLRTAAEPAVRAGLTVEYRGMVIDAATEPTTGAAELVGLGAALIVLLVAFGSVVAAGLPILIALAGMAVGTALVLLVGSVVEIPTSAPIIAVMLGMGAGIDYALFIVTRFRGALAESPLPPGRARTVAAVSSATGTAGHAVLFAGATVVIAIGGLWFAGIPFVGYMGLAAALTVMAMVLAALTLLPALLGLVGDRVDALRIRVGRGGCGPRRSVSAWASWGGHVARSRWGYAIGTAVVLLALTSPLLSLRLGAPDDGTQPEALTQRRAYDLISEHFGPGVNGPLIVVVDGGTPAVDNRLTEAITADREVVTTSPPMRSADGSTALITLVPRHAPQDRQIADLVHRIRNQIIPAAFADTAATSGTPAADATVGASPTADTATAGQARGRAYVGGATALIIDTADIVGARLPLVVLIVVGAAGLLLIAMFRAPVVALKAAVATSMSVGASYGVLVAVFQWGWGLDMMGIDKPVPIMSIVPLLLFAVLFGLSMDYEVFLLSSISQAYRQHRDPRRATVTGLAATGRVITAAAVIMACVFLSFVSINDSLVKMLGLGLATAVIVDATLIRSVLVPAVMAILGHLAWWRPFTASDTAGDASTGPVTPRPAADAAAAPRQVPPHIPHGPGSPHTPPTPGHGFPQARL